MSKCELEIAFVYSQMCRILKHRKIMNIPNVLTCKRVVPQQTQKISQEAASDPGT